MHVLRVQRDLKDDVFGHGPYRTKDRLVHHEYGYDFGEWVGHNLDNFDPETDELIRPVPRVWANDWDDLNHNYRAGFSTMTQLMNWFGPVMSELRAHEFVIAAYDVPETGVIRCDAYQVAFKQEQALRIAKSPGRWVEL